MEVWRQLIQYVEDSGFERFGRFIENGFVYVRQDERGFYAVFLLYEPMEAGIRQEDCLAQKREMEERLFRQYQKVPVWLGLLCVKEGLAYRSWCENGKIWIVERESRRVILYENQTTGFLGWEHSLERALEISPQSKQERQGVGKLNLNNRSIPVVTVFLLGINVLIFCVLELFVPQTVSAQLYSAGVMYWPAVLEKGQYYRLVTSMFLHFDSSHLMNNMLLLFMIGSRLESVVGKTPFTAIYFLSGIVADLTSMGYTIWQNRLVVSAGASGAVFGIIGSLAWIVIANKGKVQGMTSGWMVIFVVLSLYGGFANQRTDNAAHIGGFLAGLLLTACLYQWKKHRRQVR